MTSQDSRLSFEDEEGKVHLSITRPKTRGECANVPRPCPFASCSHHLLLEVSKAGTIRFNSRADEPEHLPPEASCALDVADSGPKTLDDLVSVFGVSRERVRQMEAAALAKLASAMSKDETELVGNEVTRGIVADEPFGGWNTKGREIDDGDEGSFFAESEEKACARIDRIYVKEAVEKGLMPRSKASLGATERRRKRMEEGNRSGELGTFGAFGRKYEGSFQHRVELAWKRLSEDGAKNVPIADLAREARASGNTDKKRFANTYQALSILRKKGILPSAKKASNPDWYGPLDEAIGDGEDVPEAALEPVEFEAPKAKPNRCPKCGKKDVGETRMDERCGDDLCWCSPDEDDAPEPVPYGACDTDVGFDGTCAKGTKSCMDDHHLPRSERKNFRKESLPPKPSPRNRPKKAENPAIAAMREEAEKLEKWADSLREAIAVLEELEK